MSTSVKNLTPLQIIYKRPAIAFATILFLTAMLIHPINNSFFMVTALLLYWAFYQSRYYIYKMGMGRFDLFLALIYGAIICSSFFNWYGSFLNQDFSLSGLSVTEFVKNSSYQDSVKAYIFDNLDNLIHWKMVIFSIPMAVLLYFICLELDRKTVRQSDLQSLGLNQRDLLSFNSVFMNVGLAFMVIASMFFGLQYLCYAIVLSVIYSYFPRNIYAIFSLCTAFIIGLFNFAYFNYLIFLSIPRQFISTVVKITEHSSDFTGYIKNYWQWGSSNYAQSYIFLPWLVFSGIAALIYIKNRVALEEIVKEQEQHAKIASTADALDFGNEIATGKPVRITHQELNTHMYINGGSGSGKTVAMLNFVIEAAEKRIPLIYLDGKGATDLERTISKIASINGRKFKIFTLSPEAVPATSPYDFLGSGTFTEKKNRIMELFINAQSSGSEFYQNRLETFVNRVFLLVEKTLGINIDLYRFMSLISNINDLIELASKDIILDDGSSTNFKEYFESVREMKDDVSPRVNLMTKLDPFIHSSYGHLFNLRDKDPSTFINIKQSILNDEIILFLFNASAFEQDTARVAKMVISDINATFAELGKEQKPKKTFCIFDEFKSYQTDAIGKTISLHRSNGLHAIIGTQSISVIDREIAENILSNCQTRLVMASADADAAKFSEEMGTYKKTEHTTRIKADVQEVSDITARQVDEYYVTKQDIKSIMVNTGQGYLQRKAIGAKPVKIQVTKKI